MEPVTYEPWDYVTYVANVMAAAESKVLVFLSWFLMREAAKAEIEWIRLVREGARDRAAWIIAQEDAGFLTAMDAAAHYSGIGYGEWREAREAGQEVKWSGEYAE